MDMSSRDTVSNMDYTPENVHKNRLHLTANRLHEYVQRHSTRRIRARNEDREWI